MAQTKEEKAAKQKEYRENNKDKIATTQKLWRQNNPDKVKAASKRRYANHKDEVLDKSHEYHKEVVERVGYALRNGEEWSLKEEQFIFDNMDTMTIEQMAIELNRTYDAVTTRKAVILGNRPEKTSKVKKKGRFIGKRELEALEFSNSGRERSNL